MSQSTALQYDLSEEMAAVSDLSVIVKGRILEAADTIAHMDDGQITKVESEKSAFVTSH